MVDTLRESNTYCSKRVRDQAIMDQAISFGRNIVQQEVSIHIIYSEVNRISLSDFT
jgi:hypothetical protein